MTSFSLNESQREAALREAARELVSAVKTHLATSPAFRMKPVGGEGSRARMDQDDKIAAEDMLRAAISKMEEVL